MENNQSTLEKVLAQLEGLSYRSADYVLDCAKSKLKDAAFVPKTHSTNQQNDEDFWKALFEKALTAYTTPLPKLEKDTPC